MSPRSWFIFWYPSLCRDRKFEKSGRYRKEISAVSLYAVILSISAFQISLTQLQSIERRYFPQGAKKWFGESLLKCLSCHDNSLMDLLSFFEPYSLMPNRFFKSIWKLADWRKQCLIFNPFLPRTHIINIDARISSVCFWIIMIWTSKPHSYVCLTF